MAVLLKASSAVTVTEAGLPAVTEAGVALRVRVAAAAGLTVIVELLPLIEPLPVSVAVSVWLPAVLRV